MPLSVPAEILNISSLESQTMQWGGRNRGLPSPVYSAEGTQVKMVNTSKIFDLFPDEDAKELPANLVISFEVKLVGSAQSVGIGIDTDRIAFGYENNKFILAEALEYNIYNRDEQEVADRLINMGNTSEGFTRYSLIIGGVQASYKYLALISDDREGSGGFATFKNIRIYENSGDTNHGTVTVNEDLEVHGDVFVTGDILITPKGDIPTYQP